MMNAFLWIVAAGLVSSLIAIAYLMVHLVA